MTHAVRGLGLAVTLALVSTVAFVPQAGAQSTAAYVYIQIQGPAGAVYEYNASSTGQLSAIPGSPFKPGTLIIGSNGTQFFTLGKTLIHSYGVASNGAIQAQKFQIPVLDYAGSTCGGGTNGTDAAVLDHTGRNIFVLLENGGSGTCAAYQSYIVNSDGSFTFNGDTEENFGTQSGPNFPSVDMPSILGNETFAYADVSSGHYSSPIGFRRTSSGTLEAMQFSETDPTLGGSPGNYDAAYPDASPTGNFVVLQLYPYDSTPPQLGSYTVNSQGNISTTNTSSNMPTSVLTGPYSTFSVDGKMFALYSGGGPSGAYGNGIEIYNFNGAAPLTLYKKLLTGTPIDQVAWDSSNHLYAISTHPNMLYVFTVTSTSVTQDSALSIGVPFSMVVASLAPTTTGGGGGCSAPTSNGVNVCTPSNGATVSSPVQINASATISGGVYRFELWNGSTKLLSVDNGTMDQTLALAPGTYHLTFDAYNSSKSIHEYATRDITVQ